MLNCVAACAKAHIGSLPKWSAIQIGAGQIGRWLIADAQKTEINYTVK
jgi:hypothetical protein